MNKYVKTKSNFKNGVLVSEEFALFRIYDLPFVQTKDYQY